MGKKHYKVVEIRDDEWEDYGTEQRGTFGYSFCYMIGMKARGRGDSVSKVLLEADA